LTGMLIMVVYGCDSGFMVTTRDRPYYFRPTTVKALWFVRLVWNNYILCSSTSTLLSHFDTKNGHLFVCCFSVAGSVHFYLT